MDCYLTNNFGKRTIQICLNKEKLILKKMQFVVHLGAFAFEVSANNSQFFSNF
jgi:hypothetical protein